MIWGYIKSDGSRKLVKIDGNLNSAKYIQLLKDNLIADLDDGEIFQHEGDLCHRSRATKLSLTEESIIVLSDWPALSLGLNNME